jgi:hypothetical protein
VTDNGKNDKTTKRQNGNGTHPGLPEHSGPHHSNSPHVRGWGCVAVVVFVAFFVCSMLLTPTVSHKMPFFELNQPSYVRTRLMNSSEETQPHPLKNI